MALQKSKVFQPNVHNLPVAGVDDLEEDQVTSLHRDAAVNNLRFLNIFYGYRSSTFALAVHLLDRLLGKVKVCIKLRDVFCGCVCLGRHDSKYFMSANC